MNFELDMLASEFLDIIGFKGYSEYLINKFNNGIGFELNYKLYGKESNTVRIR